MFAISAKFMLQIFRRLNSYLVTVMLWPKEKKKRWHIFCKNKSETIKMFVPCSTPRTDRCPPETLPFWASPASCRAPPGWSS